MILNKIILTTLVFFLFNQGVDKAKTEKGSVILYTANWCEPCDEMQDYLLELQKDSLVASKYNFYVVDLNQVYCVENGELDFPNQYDIEPNMIYPTVKIFNKNKTDRLRGFGFTYDEVRDYILE